MLTAAVIGLGAIGVRRAQVLHASSEITTLYGVDPSPHPDRLRKLDRLKLCELSSLPEKLDCVVIATPHDLAVKVAETLIPRSRVCLIEKPLGTTLREGEKLHALASESECDLRVGFNYRYLPHVMDLKSRILECGVPLSIEASLSHGAEPGYEKSWKTQKKACGGGVVIDPGIHLLDLLNHLFGEGWTIQNKSLSTLFWPIEVEDHATLFLKHKSKAQAVIQLSISSWSSRLSFIAEFQKEQAILTGRGRFYGPQKIQYVRRWPWTTPELERERTTDFGTVDDSLERETQDLIKLSAGSLPKESPLATSLEALSAMRLVAEAYN